MSAGRAAAPRDAPLTVESFAALIAPLGPFGRRPTMAVATSGGGDSLALCLVAHAWARRRGGAVVALTVDHGLRPAAAGEARRVAGWLADRGIELHILRWRGAKPHSGIQATAREARYRLLTGWCHGHDVVHLLLGHHLEDQAETVLLRLARQSGPDGLAGMAAISERDGVRVLRPLLATARADLRAALVARRQEWLDDPANADPRFARTRARQLLERLAPAGLTAPRLAATARRMGGARATLETATAALLAHAVVVHPAGLCWLDGAAFTSAPIDLARRALARVLMCTGGAAYPPRAERLERLLVVVRDGTIGAGRTLQGCRILAYRGRLLCCREPAAARDVLMLHPGMTARWDRRFAVDVARRGGRAAPARPLSGLSLGRLGREGWAAVAARQPALRATPVPPPARPALPALWSAGTVVAVPHVGFGAAVAAKCGVTICFKPRHALGPACFSVV